MIEMKIRFNSNHINHINYEALNAFTILSCEARSAGKNPPVIPITSAKIMVLRMTEGERLKLNASSVNDPKFSVEITKS